MTPEHIRKAVAELRSVAGMPINPNIRGPVQLDLFFHSTPFSLNHVALEPLSLSTAVHYLLKEGYITNPDSVTDLLEERTPLEGLMFSLGGPSVAFIKSDSYLPRRRFTAAHELGHALLHQKTMGRYLADAEISETDSAENEREREANQFAAELLMPEKLLRARAEQLKTELRIDFCPRTVLEYRLAAELLVSAQAIRYRLVELGVGDE